MSRSATTTTKFIFALPKTQRQYGTNTLPSLQSVCIICDALGLSLAEFFSVEILSPDCKAIMDSFETISNQSLSALAILVQHLK